MHVSQPALPDMGGGALPGHAKAASTGPPPLLVLPFPLPLPVLLEPPLLLEPALLLPLEDADPELPPTTGPELLPLLTLEPLPLPDEEAPVPPPSPRPAAGATIPPHAARPAQTPNAANRKARTQSA